MEIFNWDNYEINLSIIVTSFSHSLMAFYNKNSNFPLNCCFMYYIWIFNEISLTLCYGLSNFFYCNLRWRFRMQKNHIRLHGKYCTRTILYQHSNLPFVNRKYWIVYKFVQMIYYVITVTDGYFICFVRSNIS